MSNSGAELCLVGRGEQYQLQEELVAALAPWHFGLPFVERVWQWIGGTRQPKAGAWRQPV